MQLQAVLDAADFQGDISLTTDTAGDYVATVANGTGVDGTASGEGSTYTPTLDLTELSTFTLGTGTATGIIFDAGATDPRLKRRRVSFTIDIGGPNETTLTAFAFCQGWKCGQCAGTTSLASNDLFLDTGATINIESGNSLATHTSGFVTGGHGDLRITTAGTNTASAVTVGGTQTLTSKSYARRPLRGLRRPQGRRGPISERLPRRTLMVERSMVWLLVGRWRRLSPETTITANTGLRANANDGADIGTATTSFSDLYLAEEGTITWDNTDCILTQTGDVLATTGCTISVAEFGRADARN